MAKKRNRPQPRTPSLPPPQIVELIRGRDLPEVAALKRQRDEALDAARDALDHATRVLDQLDRVTALWWEREKEAVRIIKELLSDADANYHTFQRMQAKEAQHWLARHKAGENTAAERRKNAGLRNEAILRHADSLLMSGRKRRDLAAILAKRHGLTSTHVRNILKKAKAS